MNKELCEQLIIVYQWAILQCMDMGHVDDMIDYLRNNSLQHGICCCAEENYDIWLYDSPWIMKHALRKGNDEGYWTRPPRWCDTKEEIIHALQTRLDILLTYDGE